MRRVGQEGPLEDTDETEVDRRRADAREEEDRSLRLAEVIPRDEFVSHLS